MSLIDTFMGCFDRLPSKRKLDDYGAAGEDGGAGGDGFGHDDASDFVYGYRTRRLANDSRVQDENPSRFVPTMRALAMANSAGCKGKNVDFACSSHASSSGTFFRGESSRSNSGVSELTHFFVIINGKSVNFHLNRKVTISTLHEMLQSLTGMRVMDQRLIFRGKQLESEQTLEECLVEKDSTMHLVSRLRSTSCPLAFQLTEHIVSTVMGIYRPQSTPLPLMLKSLKRKLMESIADIANKVLGRNDTYGNVITSRNMEQGQYLSSLSEYLEVFQTYDAPNALIALYRSSVKANRECADYCIRYFIKQVKELSKGPVNAFFATILLKFCRLLRPACNDDDDGGEDLLYLHCRSSLGSMVKIVGAASGPNEVDNIKYFMTVQDLLPFLREVVNRLKKYLAISVESNGSHGPECEHVNDFSSFLHPLWTLVEAHVRHRGLISAPSSKGKSLLQPYWEEIELLFVTFIDLCAWMEQCLERTEKNAAVKGEAVKDNFRGLSQYLAVLKELSSIAPLYEGAKDHFWNIMRCKKTSVHALIVGFANRDDNYGWLLTHKDILDFESRRHLAMLMLPEVKEDYDELHENHEMLIDRSDLLAESFRYISSTRPDLLRSRLSVQFNNEEATGPGVLREWFLLVCQAIFNSEHALFGACPMDRQRFFPSEASKVDPVNLEYFCFAGRVIALALMHKMQIGVALDRVFFVQLAEMDPCLEDIRDANPRLYSSWKQILEMDPEFVDSDALGMTFVRDIALFDSKEVVELCSGGEQITVNSENRHSYVELLIKHYFVKSISDQVSQFIRGFDDILSDAGLRRSFFKCLELEDLDGMLRGNGFAIPLEDWKLHTEYHGYIITDPQISWFWEVVGQLSEEQRKILLFFWTSVKYLPVEGFRGLASKLQIHKSLESSDHLPSSHTCFFQLCIPPYPSKEVMRERLEVITEEHVGCSFGTE